MLDYLWAPFFFPVFVFHPASYTCGFILETCRLRFGLVMQQKDNLSRFNLKEQLESWSLASMLVEEKTGYHLWLMTMNMFLMIYMCGFESDSSVDDLTVYITHIPKHMYMIVSKNTHNGDMLFGEYNWCQLMKLSAMWQVHCLNPGGFGGLARSVLAGVFGQASREPVKRFGRTTRAGKRLPSSYAPGAIWIYSMFFFETDPHPRGKKNTIHCQRMFLLVDLAVNVI